MSNNDDRNAIWGNAAGDLKQQKRVMRFLRFMFVVLGGGVSLIGICFICGSFFTAKKQSVFHQAELYVGFIFLVLGVTLFTWARRRASDHLKAIDAEEASRTMRQENP